MNVLEIKARILRGEQLIAERAKKTKASIGDDGLWNDETLRQYDARIEELVLMLNDADNKIQERLF